MADRVKSTDGSRETEEILGEKTENMRQSPSAAGRAGGEIARKIGTRDEKKRHDETSAGKTRETAQDQDESGDKEKM
ncbi:hypothetical protein [uncultured Roseovarius sp.]|uniref:hypothetical protein n=1 Tax=uncultured Roseovarius sp. TaxID=293344 RepID=UPI0026180BA4|nr:hypothetical protein [uncultured Roseovarius sp.]